MNVRQNFVDWIDNFTAKFINSIKDIEKAKDLAEFQGEDRRLLSKVEEMRTKYYDIIKIYATISASPADKKIDTIDSIRP